MQEPTPEQFGHLQSLAELTAPGGPIDADAPTATHRQAKDSAQAVVARRMVQRRILKEFFAENTEVVRDRQVVVMAGPPGAGKSSARRQRISSEDEKHWRFIDPDEFKTRLLRHARESGEYEALIPDEVRRRMDAGEVFAPGEFAALVHEESSALARQAVDEALTRGERVLIDGVNGSARKLGERVKQLAAAGYTSIEMICVDGPREVTRARVLARWAKGYDRYLADPESDVAAYQARYVPQAITDGLYEGDARFSVCTEAVATVVKAAPEGVSVQADVYYLATEDSAGHLWQSFRKDETGCAVAKHLVLPAPKACQEAAVPVVSSGEGEVHVSGYQRADGTWVHPHTRGRPHTG